jgi:hypothetical protein
MTIKSNPLGLSARTNFFLQFHVGEFFGFFRKKTWTGNRIRPGPDPRPGQIIKNSARYIKKEYRILREFGSVEILITH